MVDSIGNASGALQAVSAVSSIGSSGDTTPLQNNTAAAAADDTTSSSVSKTSDTGVSSVTDTSKKDDVKKGVASSSPVSLSEALAASGPPVNQAKIQAIRALISEGRYPISANMIASKMLQYEVPGTSTSSDSTAVSSDSSNA
ncbi:flagellar biosynthesis anti-sigma factor FlgM [Zymomonas mobilis]|uniref:Negative regulator of flagellin synthesis n=1 Tax=Zymomonas mobilis subsp. pomaceae (strain ATCC 29192 / DSM 22645 / JCM 10191 / CCUG 17912 / NBRC 13757 / NCIMB 11200 / NRRL B-4491 / Barker I) TaxID=579138 RepID=F8ERP7_ZYMMT|nr:flagellar biosynthesis anti-sigma factor FlgM [Zymomonas mobilis]AEI37505.1 Anti-sigma-28 factor FlgM family protein [Zymomonas mobilis subsp. pomaceae ATCC 29192]MDX5948873.1 flagellar biosynthesis anti-sigma factor FlgM [Zymomonas mobilis subsp. pomaceae]GEB88680.1 hypothetical protein ZMO02_03170 [Zymomonas mobilis subsp. pomaceae]